jgi:hypothetical protein
MQILMGFRKVLPCITGMVRFSSCPASTDVKTLNCVPIVFKLYHNRLTNISRNILSQLNHCNTHQTTQITRTQTQHCSHRDTKPTTRSRSLLPCKIKRNILASLQLLGTPRQLSVWPLNGVHSSHAVLKSKPAYWIFDHRQHSQKL